MLSKPKSFMERAVLMELLRGGKLKLPEFKICPLPTENGVFNQIPFGEYTEEWTESSKNQFRSIKVVMK